MKAVPRARSVRRPHSRSPPAAQCTSAAGVVLSLATLGTVLCTAPPRRSAAGVVSGTVYRDANNNGVRDAGEPGVGDIVVTAGAPQR